MIGNCNAKDLVKGKIDPDQINQRLLIMYGQTPGENLGIAVNIMVERGWIIRHFTGTVNRLYVVLEKI